MALEIQETPFVKELASNDRPTREAALSSLRTYLCSGHEFTTLDLLKIWKGLFFCVYHTSNPLPQQRLSQSLASLLLSIPPRLFLPFLSAFWSTLITYWSDIPALRLDKYLFLIRLYVSHTFLYLAQHAWAGDLVAGWQGVMLGAGEWTGTGVLCAGDAKVGDGLRYHVLDVWVDGVVGVEGWEGVGVMGPVEVLGREGRTKVVRERARAVLADERLEGREREVAGEAAVGDEFEGFGE